MGFNNSAPNDYSKQRIMKLVQSYEGKVDIDTEFDHIPHRHSLKRIATLAWLFLGGYSWLPTQVSIIPFGNVSAISR